MDRGYFKTAGWASLHDHLFSALTSASPDFPVQYFRGRKEVVLTTLTWFGGQNHFLPIAYLVTSSLILLIAVVLTVLWWKFGKNGKNMEEWRVGHSGDVWKKKQLKGDFCGSAGELKSEMTRKSIAANEGWGECFQKEHSCSGLAQQHVLENQWRNYVWHLER